MLILSYIHEQLRDRVPGRTDMKRRSHVQSTGIIGRLDLRALRRLISICLEACEDRRDIL